MAHALHRRYLTVLLHITFFLSGTATVLIGQVLPILANRYLLDDLRLSFLFSAQFCGSLTGTLLSSFFGRRGRYHWAAVTGAALTGLGLLLMNVNSYEVSLIAFAVNGLGVGLTLPSINMLIVEMSPLRAASRLSALNFCWGAGAILCKPFVDGFAGTSDLGWTTYILAAPILLAAAASAFARPPMNVKERAEVAMSERTAIWTTPTAWLIAAFNFVHVGFESGIGGWLTTYSNRADGGTVLPGVSPILAYFTFFVVGRGVAPVLLRRATQNVLLFFGLGLILVGVVTILTSAGYGMIVGSVIAGFGTSWIFPTNVARFSESFGEQAKFRATPLFLAGTLGAASSTWLIGFISSQTGELRSGMLVLVVSAAVLLVLQSLLALRSKAITAAAA